VRFRAEGQEAVVVAGEWSEEEKGVICKSPPLPKGKVSVEVALNGQQFSAHAGTLLYFEPPMLLRLSPDCMPLGEPCEVTMTCQNAFQGLKVRLLF
jgi:hypothetical protein